ncbi:ABC transporter substrate-binding protein [Nocardioides lijunqiniae]|uniref:ABC transporter substrate-binding protein n=1 Tax=Nocardioides lijunqiniae TaxID=2760832 RepID=UPI001877C7CE|nr:ABC transporter substrate-binding protein [Nocardioides lijunqiniae]
MRLRRTALAVLPVLVAAIACAPADEDDDSGAATASCEKGDLPLTQEGTLTVGTDSPAFSPWFVDEDPTSGEGFESAVAYAVADELGFTPEEVTWVTVPFNTSFAPGEKNFDFDINQISITDERKQVVDFSDGYYSASQAVVALDGSPVSEVTTVAELADYNLGAQTATTSLKAIRDVVKPDQKPAVFEDTVAAKNALLNGQTDAILADLPTAFYISAAEIPGSKLVGQFQPETGDQEEFGMLFEKGSDLVPCVNEALATLTEDGTLAEIEQKWLSDVVDVPELQ